MQTVPPLNAACVMLAAAAVLLCCRCRTDGPRALEIAADKGYAIVGWTLMCYGAQALPSWAVSGRPHPLDVGAAKTPSSLTHEMLMCNAVQCQEHPW